MRVFNQLGISSILLVILVMIAISVPLGIFYLRPLSETKQPLSSVNTSPSADQGKTLSSETEKFFEETIKGKAENYTNQFEEAKKTGEWITYKNEEFNYEFSYPATWSSPQTWMGDPDFHLFYPNSNPEDYYYLDLKNSNQLDKNKVKNLCGNNNQSSRCQTINLETTKATIDWGDSQPEKAIATILHPSKNYQAVFELKPVTDESRSAFKEIISSFKFN